MKCGSKATIVGSTPAFFLDVPGSNIGPEINKSKAFIVFLSPFTFVLV
jgi:hypothetical protein